MAKKEVAKKKIIKKKQKAQKQGYGKYLLLLAFLFIIGLLAYILYREFASAHTSFASEKYQVRGVDLSHHNPIIQWTDMVEQGVTFTYLKATEGTTHKDRNYPYNYDLAKKTGVNVGAYHFFTFSDSGEEQARHFIKIAQLQSRDMIPAIDVEHSKSNPESKDTTYVKNVIKELKVLEKTLYEYYGIRPIIYTNNHCYNLYIKNNFEENLIWICSLYTEPDENINWRIWQYSHQGKLRGVDEDIDLNYYRYSFDEFKELLLP